MEKERKGEQTKKPVEGLNQKAQHKLFPLLPECQWPNYAKVWYSTHSLFSTSQLQTDRGCETRNVKASHSSTQQLARAREPLRRWWYWSGVGARHWSIGFLARRTGRLCSCCCSQLAPRVWHHPTGTVGARCGQLALVMRYTTSTALARKAALAGPCPTSVQLSPALLHSLRKYTQWEKCNTCTVHWTTLGWGWRGGWAIEPAIHLPMHVIDRNGVVWNGDNYNTDNASTKDGLIIITDVQSSSLDWIIILIRKECIWFTLHWHARHRACPHTTVNAHS